MNRLHSLCTLIILLAVVAFPCQFLASTDAEALEDHMRQVRRKIEEKRNSAMSTLMVMTDDQSKAFRTLQKSYNKELNQLGKQDRKMISEFSEIFDKLTAESAEDMGKRFFELKRERLALQEKYLKLISDEVSPVIAVQFIQLERRFEAQMENERLKYSPLAE